jgi:hypothetical protein
MMAVRKRVLRFLTHTRFVPTPLYRLMVLAWGISGVLSLPFLMGPAESVREVNNSWLDWALPVLQIGAAVTVLTGLYLVEGNTHHASKLARSLTLELFGIIEIEVVIAWQIAAATIYQDRVPTSGPSWMAIVFGSWILFRVKDIVLATRKLGETP